VCELRQANEILRKARAYGAQATSTPPARPIQIEGLHETAGMSNSARRSAGFLRQPSASMASARCGARCSVRALMLRAARSPERLAKAGIEPSVGRVGASYDTALAQTVIGLFKTEVIHRRGPWRSFEAVEFATLAWVDWFNNRRLLEPIGNIPPAEADAAYYAQLEIMPMAA
jgi:transposase InsO family protein